MAIDWDVMVLGPLMDVFGEPATYLPAAGGSYSIEGVFDAAYQELKLLDDGSTINTERPLLGVRSTEFQSRPKQNDRVSIASVNSTFVVRDVQPDGHGFIKLMLNLVSSP